MSLTTESENNNERYEVQATVPSDTSNIANINQSATTEKYTRRVFNDISSIEQNSEISGFSDLDGGRGWLVVFGAFFVQFTSFGILGSWYYHKYDKHSRVMQNCYHQLYFHGFKTALLELSFVGTMGLAISNALAPFSQIAVSRFGVKPVMIFASICMVTGLELAGFATKIWQLYLTQGFLFGIGVSCMYFIALSVTPQWFSKRRGMAMGIATAGTGMGGLIVPFIATPINRVLGPSWTYRIFGLICVILNSITCLTITPRICQPTRNKKLSEIFQLNVLRNPNFLVFVLGTDVALLGYWIPSFFVPVYATHLGLSAAQGSSMISVMSGTNFIGRIIAGLLADCIGQLNTFMIFTLATSLSCFLIWTSAYSYSSLMCFSVLYGLTSGCYFAIMSTTTSSILGSEQFPFGLSLLIATNALTMFGSNIASSIELATSSSPFLAYKLFTGSAFLAGFLIISVLKFRLNKRLFAKV